MNLLSRTEIVFMTVYLLLDEYQVKRAGRMLVFLTSIIVHSTISISDQDVKDHFDVRSYRKRGRTGSGSQT